MKEDIVLILIHGTFAPNTPWVLEGSLFREWLADELKDHNVVFDYIRWPGTVFIKWPKFLRDLQQRLNNSFRHRRQGAETLVEKVREVKTRYPEAKIFLIGHSHGGSVALYALNDEETAMSVTGIVSLSTPFILISPKRYGAFSHILLVCSWLCTSLLTSVLVGLCFGISLSRESIGSYLSIFCLALLPNIALLKHIKRWALRRRDRIAFDLRTPAINPSEAMILSCEGDEVSVWLAILRLLTVIPQWMMTPKPLAWLISVGTVIAYPYWNQLRIDYAGEIGLFRSLLLTVFSLPACAMIVVLGLYIVAFVCGSLITTVIKASPLGIGAMWPWDTVLVGDNIRKTPYSCYEWTGRVTEVPGLIHSRLYDDERSVRSIGAFIGSRCCRPNSQVVDQQYLHSAINYDIPILFKALGSIVAAAMILSGYILFLSSIETPGHAQMRRIREFKESFVEMEEMRKGSSYNMEELSKKTQPSLQIIQAMANGLASVIRPNNNLFLTESDLINGRSCKFNYARLRKIYPHGITLHSIEVSKNYALSGEVREGELAGKRFFYRVEDSLTLSEGYLKQGK